jgi:hypothetical protein
MADDNREDRLAPRRWLPAVVLAAGAGLLGLSFFWPSQAVSRANWSLEQAKAFQAASVRLHNLSFETAGAAGSEDEKTVRNKLPSKSPGLSASPALYSPPWDCWFSTNARPIDPEKGSSNHSSFNWQRLVRPRPNVAAFFTATRLHPSAQGRQRSGLPWETAPDELQYAESVTQNIAANRCCVTPSA